jgi:hypothetical protein
MGGALAALGLLVIVVCLVVYSARARTLRRLEHVTRRPLGVAGGRFTTDGEPLTSFEGREAAWSWEERLSPAGEEMISRITLDVTVPGLTGVQVRAEPPEDASQRLYGWDGPLSGHRILGADGAEALVWFPADFGEALLASLDGPKCWGTIALVEGGTLTFSRAFPHMLRPEDAAPFAAPLSRLARALLDTLPRDPDPVGALDRRLRAPREHRDVHWRAARALFERHGGSPEAQSVAEDIAVLPEFTRLAAAVWGDPGMFHVETRYALLCRARTEEGHPELQRGAHGRLLEDLPWRALMDATMPPDVRVEAARHALGSDDAPGDHAARQAALLDLFTDDQFPDQAALYRALSGWSPSTPARVRLVELAYAGLREVMIEELRARRLTPDDAPVVAALAQRGDDVDDLVDALRDAGVHAIGQLSLAGDATTSGALTASRGAGDLTISNEEEPEP